MGDDEDRYLVVDGRRWRRTDPAIPETLRKELVAELMAARRAVGAAEDDDARATARAHVDAAKRALGERGLPWWEVPGPSDRRARLRATVLTLARHRHPRTICPSDAARAAGGAGWRGWMQESRDCVRDLAADGVVVLLQRGEAIDPHAGWKGPIRVRLEVPDDPQAGGP